MAPVLILILGAGHRSSWTVATAEDSVLHVLLQKHSMNNKAHPASENYPCKVKRAGVAQLRGRGMSLR